MKVIKNQTTKPQTPSQPKSKQHRRERHKSNIESLTKLQIV